MLTVAIQGLRNCTTQLAEKRLKMLRQMLLILSFTTVLVLAILALSSARGEANSRGCPEDSVEAGSWCVDKYEASAWETDNARIINQIKQGRVKSETELIGKATQRGKGGVDDYDQAGCPNTGNGCTRVFAVSIQGVNPSLNATWFQAAAACRNAGKELLPNTVWQVAALGTPDPGLAGDGINTCNTHTAGPLPTGSAPNCVSDVGAFDMVGNVQEWTADWVPVSAGCVSSMFGSGDFNCFVASNITSPGSAAASLRGGDSATSTAAGVFSIDALITVEHSLPDLGFRCGRIKER